MNIDDYLATIADSLKHIEVEIRHVHYLLDAVNEAVTQEEDHAEAITA